MKKTDARIVDLYNDYIHGDMPRREFLRRAATIAGGATAASLILPLVESNFAWGQQVDPGDERLEQGYLEYPGTRGPVRAYYAKPAGSTDPLPAILVIHENRGLNAHIEDVARRAALGGYLALAPDGLTFAGGAPVDQEEARNRFREADTDVITADVIAGIDYLKSSDSCNGKVGATGFCYGGGVALQCMLANPPADAAVLFYGRALSAEEVAQVDGPIMLNYGGDDARVNAGIPEFRASLDANNVAYTLNMYPGCGHGFHNDTSQSRYVEASAKLAWKRTMRFFDHYLGS